MSLILHPILSLSLITPSDLEKEVLSLRIDWFCCFLLLRVLEANSDISRLQELSGCTGDLLILGGDVGGVKGMMIMGL